MSRTEYEQLYRIQMEEFNWELAQQEYEALYILTEEMNAKDISESLFTTAVVGYHDSQKVEITIVGEVRMDEATLAHELTHTLIDQHFPEIFTITPEFTDESFALSGLIEGEAEFVKELYRKTWGYTPTGVGGGSLEEVPWGFILIHYFPYIEGLNFVRELRMQDGWKAVHKAYMNPPQSTEQIIHPEKYGIDEPVTINISDRNLTEWRVLGRDTLGELAIFLMFWNQGMVPLGVKDGSYTYSANVSEGWDGDQLVVYKKHESYGYVWRILWDSKNDSEEFVDGYEWMLWNMKATKVQGLWKLDQNDYIKIILEGETTTIINAPSPEEISKLWPTDTES